VSDPRFDNNMRGVLFKNDKAGVETRADYQGHCEINKVEFYINAWINQDKGGHKYMSLRFRAKASADRQDAPRSPPPIGKPEPRVPDPFDDEIPF
jgi:hypothetical protein